MNSDINTKRTLLEDNLPNGMRIDHSIVVGTKSTQENNKRKGSDSELGDAKKRIKTKQSPDRSSPANTDKHNGGGIKSADLRERTENGDSDDMGTNRNSDANADSATEQSQSDADDGMREEIVSKYLELHALPADVEPLRSLTNAEKKELENCLHISKHGWREDWIGNLAFADKDIPNPDGKSREKGKKALFRWAERGKLSRKLLNNLLRFVYNLTETPKQAKIILASADPKSVRSIQDAVRRVSYDPAVLQEDGWTTAKSPAPIGASGGPFRIGEMVHWQGYTGVVIAYIHDEHLGDLWKAMWLQEFDTFDLEAEELDDARKKYDRRKKSKEQKETSKPSQMINEATRRSGRYSSADFTVKGIEHGIVLAVSYSRGSRPGVFWPARVMHFSEMESQARRGSQKQKVDVVFLAPYWNATPGSSSGRKESYSESLSRHGGSIFSAGSLFELETIDASDESIQEYPYRDKDGLDIDQLRTSFKFVGLPKAAFPRFVDAHRLALGLQTYSRNVMKSTVNSDDLHLTTAGLFEAHPIAAQTAHFPEAVLHLPFDHVLSQLPRTDTEEDSVTFDDSESNKEPVLQLGAMLDSMKPPNCWGIDKNVSPAAEPPQLVSSASSTYRSPEVSMDLDTYGEVPSVNLNQFTYGLSSLNSLFSEKDKESPMSALLGKNLSQLVAKIPGDSSDFNSLSFDAKRARCQSLIKLWTVVKDYAQQYLVDWCKLCERLYRYITIVFSAKGIGNKVSWVMTDSLCNQHLTSNGCFERAVRLPAAVKAAKQAGAGESENIQLMTAVNERYIELAEKHVINKAHSKSYLHRMKKRCMSVADDKNVVPLTEDSEGNGGEDTKGSKGSWKAAIAGVGSAVQAVDMIMNGECVNVFSVTRPPGHHAGRDLHPMKAVSNGFCLLNPVACAALYATSSIAGGGRGLKRVCVIDIDVHHGNGTQDILCSTYDPRFLYVSLHSGGPDVNGLDPADDTQEELAHHLGRNPKKGIFPGRCGDFSPHDGVLNIPLGSRVTPHAIGTALVTKVTPAVEKFSPDLIIMSTGFDAHMNDPLGLGGLRSEDFGTLTEVICKLAHKSCSGRVLSVLEGGYGVPCCRPPVSLFDPDEARAKVNGDNGGPTSSSSDTSPSQQVEASARPASNSDTTAVKPEQNALQLLELGEDLPTSMDDDVSLALGKRLDKCHKEGFMHCVREHILALKKSNVRS
eukprot:scaffold22740_cov139-Cylindrotheca_fusiformis.AAC.7